MIPAKSESSLSLSLIFYDAAAADSAFFSSPVSLAEVTHGDMGDCVFVCEQLASTKVFCSANNLSLSLFLLLSLLLFFYSLIEKLKER